MKRDLEFKAFLIVAQRAWKNVVDVNFNLFSPACVILSYDKRRAIMSAILKLIAGHRIENFDAGGVVIEQGATGGPMFVIIQGEIEVLRDNVRVAKISEPGAVFGEMHVLSGCPHSATIRTLKPSSFAIIEDPRQFLASSAEASLYVAELLAVRLNTMNKYLVDVKQQYEGHDHLGMVDEVLNSLVHRQPLRSGR
jgi:CRP/FNR family transcriptional regulator, cyclic AMP receptor protein